MEATQALTESALEASDIHMEDDNDENAHPRKLIGVLLLEEEHKEYNIFQGDIISIGRDPENCQVIIDNKVRNII